MRLLVIEDEPRIRSFLTRGLEAEGYAVDAADTGLAGLEQVRRGHYDLVVLDLLLPGVDGLTVLRKLHAERPGLPVLILSARADLRTKLLGFELGARDYLAKPFSLEELLARIRVQLDTPAPPEEPIVQVGQLVVDLARRRVVIGGTAADLSDREFRLLHHLAAHPGEVVSRERLLAEVWGYHFDPRSNVVEVCIRRLRKKLGPTAPIQTIRHAGYRLAAA
jgi:two-component system, OmpR family, copper resistance phosphate regulon response regulator CusR